MKNLFFFKSFLIVMLFITIESYGQEVINNKEKNEEVARIRKEIEEFNEMKTPEIRYLLLNSNVSLTKNEIDSFTIAITPRFKIKKESAIRSDDMIRDDTLMINDEHGFGYNYDFKIIPPKDKNTIYSAISNIFDSSLLDESRIRLYNKDKSLAFWVSPSTPKDTNILIKLTEVSEESEGSKKYKEYDNKTYSDKYLSFLIDIDKDMENDYLRSRKAINFTFKDPLCIIYDNRIYSYICLVRTFKSTDLDWIFENHSNDLCDCDIDVFFRKNKQYSDFLKEHDIK